MISRNNSNVWVSTDHDSYNKPHSTKHSSQMEERSGHRVEAANIQESSNELFTYLVLAKVANALGGGHTHAHTQSIPDKSNFEALAWFTESHKPRSKPHAYWVWLFQICIMWFGTELITNRPLRYLASSSLSIIRSTWICENGREYNIKRKYADSQSWLSSQGSRLARETSKDHLELILAGYSWTTVATVLRCGSDGSAQDAYIIENQLVWFQIMPILPAILHFIVRAKVSAS